MSERPKLLHRGQPVTWWLKKPAYLLFMLREFSCVFVLIAAVATLLQVSAIKGGYSAYWNFQQTLQSPLALGLALLALAFCLLHTITFFLLAGRVLVVRFGEKPVPGRAIIAGHFAGWFVVSLIILWIVL